MNADDGEIRVDLGTLDPKARDDLRRVLIRDQPDRDAITSHLLPLPRRTRRRLADIIDTLTMHPDVRRKVARPLGERPLGELGASG